MHANDASDRTVPGEVRVSTPAARHEGDRLVMRPTTPTTRTDRRAERGAIVTGGRPAALAPRRELRAMPTNAHRPIPINRHPKFQERSAMSYDVMQHYYAEARSRDMLAQAERARDFAKARAAHGDQNRIAVLIVAARHAAGAALVAAGERLQGAHRAAAAEPHADASPSPSTGTLRLAR